LAEGRISRHLRQPLGATESLVETVDFKKMTEGYVMKNKRECQKGVSSMISHDVAWLQKQNDYSYVPNGTVPPNRSMQTDTEIYILYRANLHSFAAFTDLSLSRVRAAKKLYGAIGISRCSLGISSDGPSLVGISDSHCTGLRLGRMSQLEPTAYTARHIQH